MYMLHIGDWKRWGICVIVFSYVCEWINVFILVSVF